MLESTGFVEYSVGMNIAQNAAPSYSCFTSSTKDRVGLEVRFTGFIDNCVGIIYDVGEEHDATSGYCICCPSNYIT